VSKAKEGKAIMRGKRKEARVTSKQNGRVAWGSGRKTADDSANNTEKGTCDTNASKREKKKEWRRYGGGLRVDGPNFVQD